MLRLGATIPHPCKQELAAGKGATVLYVLAMFQLKKWDKITVRQSAASARAPSLHKFRNILSEPAWVSDLPTLVRSHYPAVNHLVSRDRRMTTSRSSERLRRAPLSTTAHSSRSRLGRSLWRHSSSTRRLVSSSGLWLLGSPGANPQRLSLRALAPSPNVRPFLHDRQ